jgi:hypothetical protein
MAAPIPFERAFGTTVQVDELEELAIVAGPDRFACARPDRTVGETNDLAGSLGDDEELAYRVHDHLGRVRLKTEHHPFGLPAFVQRTDRRDIIDARSSKRRCGENTIPAGCDLLEPRALEHACRRDVVGRDDTEHLGQPRPLDHGAHSFARDPTALHRRLDGVADFDRAAIRAEPDVTDEHAVELDAEHERARVWIERLRAQRGDDLGRVRLVAIDLIRNPPPHAGFLAHREDLRHVRSRQRPQLKSRRRDHALPRGTFVGAVDWRRLGAQPPARSRSRARAISFGDSAFANAASIAAVNSSAVVKRSSGARAMPIASTRSMFALTGATSLGRGGRVLTTRYSVSAISPPAYGGWPVIARYRIAASA